MMVWKLQIRDQYGVRAEEINQDLRNVIFTHELVKLDVVGVLPPLLPLGTTQITSIGIILGDGYVSDAGIEPHVKDLVRVFLVAQSLESLGNGNTPLEISGDTTGQQTLIDPRLSNGGAVGAPFSLGAALLEPRNKFLLQRV